MSANAQADAINFGNNNSEFANDGECDDRRFFGEGMSADLDADDVGADADDCAWLFEIGAIALWVEEEARVATRNLKINLGDDSSDWANDGKCDDVRFEGPDTASITATGDIGRDKSDCQRALDLGTIFLRNYK